MTCTPGEGRLLYAFACGSHCRHSTDTSCGKCLTFNALLVRVLAIVIFQVVVRVAPTGFINLRGFLLRVWLSQSLKAIVFPSLKNR